MNIDLPTGSDKGAYGIINVTPRLGLLSPQGRSDLGKKYVDVTGSKLPTFEALRQRGGYVLYETAVGEASGLLSIKQPRDRIYVYVDGVSSHILISEYSFNLIYNMIIRYQLVCTYIYYNIYVKKISLPFDVYILFIIRLMRSCIIISVYVIYSNRAVFFVFLTSFLIRLLCCLCVT